MARCRTIPNWVPSIETRCQTIVVTHAFLKSETRSAGKWQRKRERNVAQEENGSNHHLFCAYYKPLSPGGPTFHCGLRGATGVKLLFQNRIHSIALASAQTLRLTTTAPWIQNISLLNTLRYQVKAPCATSSGWGTTSSRAGTVATFLTVGKCSSSYLSGSLPRCWGVGVSWPSGAGTTAKIEEVVGPWTTCSPTSVRTVGTARFAHMLI